MINKIYLSQEMKTQYLLPGDSNSISELNKINIFVGPNNSGKSRFIRALFSNAWRYQHSDFDFAKYVSTADRIQKSLDAFLSETGFTDVKGKLISSIGDKINQIVDKFKIKGLPDEYNNVQDLLSFVKTLADLKVESASNPSESAPHFDPQVLSRKVREIGNSYLDQLTPLDKEFRLPDYTKIYVPMLRGLRPTQITSSSGFDFEENKDNYKNRTIFDYFPGNPDQPHRWEILEKNLNVFSGLNLYNEVKRKLLGTIKDREGIRSFEAFLSNNFFESQPVSLTPNIDKDCLFVTIGEFDRPIYDMGDGIQSLIILLYPIFFNSDKNLLYFIEEPEASLHPGFQRVFLDTILQSRFDRVQFFFTTHSNHFLDMTLDHQQISIFNFSSARSIGDQKYNVENTQNEDIRLLDALGIRNSSVFTSNCTVWVEGITDRLYINRFMDMIQRAELKEKYETKRLKEDLHFSYIEYGGANVVHYSFDDSDNWEKIKATKISTKIMVIVDEDGTRGQLESKKKERIEELKKHLDDRLIVLPCREIENSLSVKVLRATLIELEKDDELDFGTITEKDYKDRYLGAFISDEVKGIKRSYISNGGSGTLKDKVAFCKTAISNINSVDDLSPAGKLFATKILEFIRVQNGWISK